MFSRDPDRPAGLVADLELRAPQQVQPRRRARRGLRRDVARLRQDPGGGAAQRERAGPDPGLQQPDHRPADLAQDPVVQARRRDAEVRQRGLGPPVDRADVRRPGVRHANPDRCDVVPHPALRDGAVRLQRRRSATPSSTPSPTWPGPRRRRTRTPATARGTGTGKRAGKAAQAQARALLQQAQHDFAAADKALSTGTSRGGSRSATRPAPRSPGPSTCSADARFEHPDSTRKVALSDAGWSSSVARWAHNPEVAGSNPAPATNVMSQDIPDSRTCGSRFGCLSFRVGSWVGSPCWGRR